MSTRQIFLDTETTGLEPTQGHRIIEIGCVEMINRRLTQRHFHCYLNPEREIDAGAISVHGLTVEFLRDKPIFSECAQEFLDFVKDAELIIHNAPFDVGFLNHELSKLPGSRQTIDEACSIIDSLVLARRKHPGQRNNLDALCQRYSVNNTHREWHGALLDAQLLAQVYLAMTGGQAHLFQADEQEHLVGQVKHAQHPLDTHRPRLPTIAVSEAEETAHQALLEKIKKTAGVCVWET